MHLKSHLNFHMDTMTSEGCYKKGTGQSQKAVRVCHDIRGHALEILWKKGRRIVIMLILLTNATTYLKA
jgi:hypothetical protein